MKIFIGTVNVTDSLKILQKGFAELGIQADIAILDIASTFYGASANVINVIPFYENAQKRIAKDGTLLVKADKDFVSFACQYDVFIIISSTSILPRLTDLPILHAMGKTIMCYQMGSELRHEITSVPFWSAYGHVFPQKAYSTTYFNADPEEHISEKIFNASPFLHNLTNKYYNSRMAEKYATTICTNPSVFSLGIRPYMHVPLPFDDSICTFSLPKNDIPVVVHAPSNTEFKRTNLIVKTMKELKDEGVPFKLLIAENVTNATVIETLRYADVLIDEVVGDSIARLSLEGMASGCAVVAGNSGCAPWPPDRPALCVTPLNLKERLREVLTNKALRVDLAMQGLAYMEKGYHKPKEAAQSILDAIAREKEKKFDYYPTIFTEIAKNTFKEPIPPFLQNMTLDVLKTHGTSPLTDMEKLEQEGFIPSQSASAEIPRWDMSKLHKIGPWNWCGKHIPVPTFDRENIF